MPAFTHLDLSPTLLRKREREKYAFLCFHPSCLVSAVLHAATQCYLLFVSGERI